MLFKRNCITFDSCCRLGDTVASLAICLALSAVLKRAHLRPCLFFTATPPTLDTYLRKNLFFLFFLLRITRGVFLLSGNVSELYLDDVFFLPHSHLLLFRPHFSPSPCCPAVNIISQDLKYRECKENPAHMNASVTTVIMTVTSRTITLLTITYNGFVKNVFIIY